VIVVEETVLERWAARAHEYAMEQDRERGAVVLVHPHCVLEVLRRHDPLLHLADYYMLHGLRLAKCTSARPNELRLIDRDYRMVAKLVVSALPRPSKKDPTP
jgi:hypothetical protein